MALRLKRPDLDVLAEMLAVAATDELTYLPADTALGVDARRGFKSHRWATQIAGQDVLARGREALRSWDVHRRSGLLVLADGVLTPGTNVAMTAPTPLGHVDICCRVVDVVDEADRFGFSYGTLGTHPEQGEEQFMVVRDDRGTTFTIEAVSRSSYRVARVAPWLTDHLQSSASGRYLRAFRAAVEGEASEPQI